MLTRLGPSVDEIVALHSKLNPAFGAALVAAKPAWQIHECLSSGGSEGHQRHVAREQHELHREIHGLAVFSCRAGTRSAIAM